jgi:hypothetical protein
VRGPAGRFDDNDIAPELGEYPSTDRGELVADLDDAKSR